MARTRHPVASDGASSDLVRRAAGPGTRSAGAAGETPGVTTHRPRGRRWDGGRGGRYGSRNGARRDTGTPGSPSGRDPGRGRNGRRGGSGCRRSSPHNGRRVPPPRDDRGTIAPARRPRRRTTPATNDSIARQSPVVPDGPSLAPDRILTPPAIIERPGRPVKSPVSSVEVTGPSIRARSASE